MDRRSFLKLSATTAAFSAVAPSRVLAADAETAALPKAPRLKKAIMYATVGLKGSVMEKFKAIKEAGFAGVEPMADMDQEAVIAALQETGLQAASVCCNTHWAKPLSDPNPSVRTAGLEGLQRALRDAK